MGQDEQCKVPEFLPAGVRVERERVAEGGGGGVPEHLKAR